MKPLTATELLAVWERGLNRPLLQKTLNLLTLACPDMDADTAAKLSIGERDARLLLLREWMFGSRLMNMAVCPGCSQHLEWESGIEKFLLQPVQKHDLEQEFSMEVDDYSIRFRLPSSSDISTVIADNGGPLDPAKLLACCILDSRCKGNACSVEDLPENVVQAISRRMDEEDPQADITVALNCPNCSHHWKARFDIASYLWIEIDQWARRMLLDVQKLARAFHWSERDILTMSPVRRQLYLGMVNS